MKHYQFNKETKISTYNLFFVLLLFFICLFGTVFPARSSKAKEINKIYLPFEEEIESEKSNLKFEIIDSSYAKFNFIGGFADGKYKLVTYKIKPLRKQVFKLYLMFEKKRGIFRYSEKVIVYFWQGNRIVVFLTKYGKRKYELPKKIVKVVKTKDGYEIERCFPINTFMIPLEHAKIYLKVRVR